MAGDEEAAGFEHDFLVLEFGVEEEGHEGEGGVVVGAGFDVDAAVWLDVFEEEGDAFGGLGGGGCIRSTVGVHEEAGGHEAGEGDGFGIAPLAGFAVLLGFEEGQTALVGEGDFLFEGSVLGGDGGGLGVEAGGGCQRDEGSEGDEAAHGVVGELGFEPR